VFRTKTSRPESQLAAKTDITTLRITMLRIKM